MRFLPHSQPSAHVRRGNILGIDPGKDPMEAELLKANLHRRKRSLRGVAVAAVRGVEDVPDLGLPGAITGPFEHRLSDYAGLILPFDYQRKVVASLLEDRLCCLLDTFSDGLARQWRPVQVLHDIGPLLICQHVIDIVPAGPTQGEALGSQG